MVVKTARAPSVTGKTLEYHRGLVEQVVRLIRRRVREPLNLAEIADLAYLSPFHFNRVFRSITGIPPIQFHHACRIEEARKLLLTTDRSVTDICFDVGYNSLGTFTTRFTDLVGMSPRSLRAHWRDLSRIHIPNHNSQATSHDSIVNHGRLITGGQSVAFAAIGVFRSAIPQSEPITCALVRSDTFSFGALPEGVLYLFALCFGAIDDPASMLLSDKVLRASSGAVRIAAGRAERSIDLVVRSPRVTDPPILWAKPLLVAKALQATVGV